MKNEPTGHQHNYMGENCIFQIKSLSKVSLVPVNPTSVAPGTNSFPVSVPQVRPIVVEQVQCQNLPKSPQAEAPMAAVVDSSSPKSPRDEVPMAAVDNSLMQVFSKNGQTHSAVRPEKTGDVALTIPDLVAFLAKNGIATAAMFLNVDIVTLAEAYAIEKMVNKQVALDIIGAARLFVRQRTAS